MTPRAAATLTLTLGALVAILSLGVPAPELAAQPHGAHAARSAESVAPIPADVASYRMDVRLADDHRTIDATETVRWVNTSTVPVTELWWHLYMNAFADGRSVFMRSGGLGGHRGHEPGVAGRTEVRSLRLATGEDLLAGATNDPEVREDTTQLRTPLPRPVPPGGEIELVVAFRTVLPAVFARTGYWQDFAFAGQWFPKLAVLERDGRWAHFAFHSNSEFYADFGRYEVTLTVPRGDVVGATGEERPGPDGDETARRTFVAEHVHDFAWTAWSRFRERRETIHGVRVRALYAPGLEGVTARNLAGLRAAIPSFARRYGPYPYPGLTVVVPPPGAAGVEGMEYPTLITTGGAWFAPGRVHDAEYVAIHEFGHQYFYGLVASNESAWPFLDEGLTEYATGLVMEEHFARGREMVDAFALSVGYWGYQGGFSGMISRPMPISSRAAEFPAGMSYGSHVYRRTASVLRTAEWAYGAAAVERALRSYALTWRFRHPTPDALLDAFAAEVGDDGVARFLRPAVLGDATLDYRVASVASWPSPGGGYAGRAIVRRAGTLEVPVEIELEGRDGRRTRVRWDGRGDTFAAPYAGAAPLRAARLDPDARVPLDADRTNDARAASGRGGAALPLTARIAYWVGAALRAVGP